MCVCLCLRHVSGVQKLKSKRYCILEQLIVLQYYMYIRKMIDVALINSEQYWNAQHWAVFVRLRTWLINLYFVPPFIIMECIECNKLQVSLNTEINKVPTWCILKTNYILFVYENEATHCISRSISGWYLRLTPSIDCFRDRSCALLLFITISSIIDMCASRYKDYDSRNYFLWNLHSKVAMQLIT